MTNLNNRIIDAVDLLDKTNYRGTKNTIDSNIKQDKESLGYLIDNYNLIAKNLDEVQNKLYKKILGIPDGEITREIYSLKLSIESTHKNPSV